MPRPEVLLALALLACGASEPYPVYVRVEVADPDAAFVSYRVWDEGHLLLRDELLPATDFPRWVELFPDDTDPRDPRFRGALVEVESWSEDLCPRARTSVGLRYGVTGAEQVLTLPAPEGLTQCTSLFVDTDASGDECSFESPCADVGDALDRIDGVPGRIVIHVAGGEYPVLRIQGRLRRVDAGRPNVIRAWPGRGTPVFRTGPGRECETQDDCGNNSHCVRGRCADQTPINLCCEAFDDAPINLEVDGVRTRGGAFGVEINGAHDVTVRHCRIDDAGGPRVTIPGGGMRIFRSPGTTVEHVHVAGVDNPEDVGEDAVGILVDGYSEDVFADVRLLRNRVERTEGAGVFLRFPNSPLTLRGNTWCETGAAALHVGSGVLGVDAQHELFVGNARDVEVEEATELRIARSTLTGEVASEVDVRESVVAETRGENRDTAPDVDGCLVGRAEDGYGVCATFPFCD